MRIAIFSCTYAPVVNGVAVSIANLRAGLLKTGHEVDIFAPAPPGYDESTDPENVFRYKSFYLTSKADYPIALPIGAKVQERLAKGGYDVVHLHHPWLVGTWGRKYARRMKIPVLDTVHTQYEIYSKLAEPIPSPWINPILRRKLIRHCNAVDLVTTPGEGSREALLGLGIRTPIKVVSNPTDLSSYWNAKGDEVRLKYGIDERSIVIGYAGRLSKEKNVDELIQAFQFISQTDTQVKLMIIGGGPEASYLRSLADSLAYGKVIFAGQVPHDQIAQYYGAIDIFLTASRSEVQPMSFAEAMAAGNPVVAYDVPGCNNMVQDSHGVLVDPGTGSAGLAFAVLSLMQNEDELRRKMYRSIEWAKRYDLLTATASMVEAYAIAEELSKKRAA
jgi:glycosyltransferase involved in cell wall biosynthesis